MHRIKTEITTALKETFLLHGAIFPEDILFYKATLQDINLKVKRC